MPTNAFDSAIICKEFQKNQNDTRPVAIVASIGLHLGTNAKNTIHALETLIPFFLSSNSKCPEVEVKVLWISLGAQARRLDNIYPHQSRENAAIFNHEVSEYLKKNYSSKVDFLDVLELTRDAMTSDGVHYLSDVNLIKAAYVLNYLLLL